MVAIRDDERLLTCHEVIERTRLSRTTLYRAMREGRFPLPLKVGVKAIRWKGVEINEWLESRQRAKPEIGGGVA